MHAAEEPRAFPTKVGRFRVLSHLASGGMAEVLLAAADGVEGFTRPVVIKRVLPHLANHAEFRRMFVDEARILSRLRHSNLVAVEELGEEGEGLYLVMEYLHGEGLDSIVRVQRERTVRMPPALAAYIVAEACAGLHAAHEHRDIADRPLEIVHRDVSPQNLFITYDGNVKVIDFGIAKAVNRETKTETGTVKGKFAYMSPEQIEGAEIDRRTDVFALGVVLHELLTGQRLFQRPNHLEIVRAICLVPTPPPSRFDPSVPDVLERVVMRALSKSRAERQPTALMLRHELLHAIESLGETPQALAMQLASHVGQLFEDRRREKSELMQRTSLTYPRMESSPPVDITIALAEAPSRPWTRIALGVVLVAAAALLIAFGASRATQAHTLPIAPLDASVAPPDAGTDAVVSQADADSGLVYLHVESDPVGAVISIDGVARGITPMPVSVPRGSVPVALHVEAEGRRDVDRTIVPDMDQRIWVTLPPAARARPRPSTSAPDPFGRVD